ncbi:HD domain-containing protein [Caproiciproducens faecalis]|uniref:HD domain-containing protein n=1 Tax=Caproiciproducens faecalis TaxID=2820301 RepID=A0ABS7DKD2_9FIRM|nr:HD domain-containing protein [Caproiciproducens faecalis]MBW7571755.1 HD domain-containing protein [Caproiciproducens faecalis]
MNNLSNTILKAMISYNVGDPKRVQHALKVYAFAKSIGELEGLDGNTAEILELAAILHDIGICNSEKKYGSSAGKYQELEGPPIAKKILLDAGAEQAVIDRVCFLIGHHHTYTEISGLDYQILVEADFLVNLYEDGMGKLQAQTVLQKYFKTKTGKEYLTEMYLQSEAEE